MNIPKQKLQFEDAYELIEWLTREIRHAEANHITSEKLDEAHAYAQKYCMPHAWGKNVWHVILDDALRMRKELENK